MDVIINYKWETIMIFVVHYYSKDRAKHSIDINDAKNHMDAVVHAQDKCKDWDELIVCQRIKE